MITETATIKLTQSANGKKMKPLIDKVQTALFSLATAGIIWCAGFLFKVNATLARIEQHQSDKDKNIDDMQIKLNNVQLDIRDTRDRVIKLETIKKP